MEIEDGIFDVSQQSRSNLLEISRLRRTIWCREGGEVAPDPRRDDIVRLHLQGHEEFLISLLPDDLGQGVRADVVP